MAEFQFNNEVLFVDMMLDTPFRGAAHANAKTAEAAVRLPGNAVKSIEREKDYGAPRYHGVLVKYGITCIVRSHVDQTTEEGKFVWTDTNSEYHDFWMVD